MKTTQIKHAMAAILLAGGILLPTASAQPLQMFSFPYTIDTMIWWIIAVPVTLLFGWWVWWFFFRRTVPAPVMLPLPPAEITLRTSHSTYTIPANMMSRCTITVGRSRSCTLQLTDEHVSRKHGVISVENGMMTYTDTGSTYGSYINGNRLLPNQATPVSRGCAIQLGPREIIYVN